MCELKQSCQCCHHKLFLLPSKGFASHCDQKAIHSISLRKLWVIAQLLIHCQVILQSALQHWTICVHMGNCTHPVLSADKSCKLDVPVLPTLGLPEGLLLLEHLVLVLAKAKHWVGRATSTHSGTWGTWGTRLTMQCSPGCQLGRAREKCGGLCPHILNPSTLCSLTLVTLSTMCSSLSSW